MKKTVLRLALILTFFIPTSILALNTTDQLTNETLDKLIVLSGIDKQVSQYPAGINAGIEQANEQAQKKLSDVELKEMKKAVSDAFQASAILNTLRVNIKQNISEADAKEVLKWYESDLGKKITKVEEEASTPAAYKEMQKEAKTLAADKERVAFAVKIDDLLHISDMMVELLENTQIAVIVAISKTQYPDRDVNVNTLKTQFAPYKQQVKAKYRQIGILSMVYTYKTISIKDLNKYLRFLERQNTMKFNKSIILGFKEAFNESIEKMANSLALTFAKYNH